ncbi:MAG: T9SS type A sorting domain-containing protein [Paludibacteraceae bacterium]
MKKNLLLTLVLLALVGVQMLSSQGKYVSGDFHQHTTYSDGSYTFGYMMDNNYKYGLDWWVNSEHGGGFNRWATVSGADLVSDTAGNAVTVTWKEAGIPILGTPNGGNMWRWQSLRDWSFRDIELYRKVYPAKILIQGFEWNAPGHEHVDMALINGQFDITGRNCNALAEFEYKFDNSDKDVTNPNDWTKSTQTGHAKTLEAITWLQTYYPATSWVIPTHPERANAFKIQDFRDMNNAGPNVCFGFDSQPGHQKEANRGGYRTSSYGATTEGATWGGTGYFASKVGGVWDALLSEGRKWWLFANSDCHFNEGDFFPGEYQRTKIFVTDPKNPQQIVDGLRSGNSYVVMGDLIDSLKFNVGTATMGQTFDTNTNTVTVNIIVRDPQSTNYNTYSSLTNPELDHIDLIAGMVEAKIDPTSADYTKDNVTTTKVVARFGKAAHTDADGVVTQVWTDLGNGLKQITYEFPLTAQHMYLRLRGTNQAFGTANTEIDAQGNPIADPFGTNTAAKAFEDLWFYSNPVYVSTSVLAAVPQLSGREVSIFPNPAKDLLIVQLNKNEDGMVSLYDISGKQIVNLPLNNEKTKQISLAGLSKGTYIVKVNDFSQKVIVE